MSNSDFGISVTRVNNGSPARKKDEFANVDAEKWFAFRRLLESVRRYCRLTGSY